MQIESYFAQIQETIAASPIVVSTEIQVGRRGDDAGYIRGYLLLLDETLLHFREYVDLEEGSERLMYSYHYMSAAGGIIFRYDNVPHHPHIATHPHHKHDGIEENVTDSPAPTLAQVLTEIEKLVQTE